jgi:hypothetical protein
MQTHDQLDREHAVATSSERSFGFVFAVVFALLAGWRAWGSHADAVWWFCIAAAFGALALFWQAPLAPLNRLWTRFGGLLHALLNPVIMWLLFVVSIVPMGLLMRLAGKDFLRLRFDPAAATYWIARETEERADAMRDQF